MFWFKVPTFQHRSLCWRISKCLDRAKVTPGDHDTPGDIFSKQLFAVGSLGSLFEYINQRLRIIMQPS